MNRLATTAGFVLSDRVGFILFRSRPEKIKVTNPLLPRSDRGKLENESYGVVNPTFLRIDPAEDGSIANSRQSVDSSKVTKIPGSPFICKDSIVQKMKANRWFSLFPDVPLINVERRQSGKAALKECRSKPLQTPVGSFLHQSWDELDRGRTWT